MKEKSNTISLTDAINDSSRNLSALASAINKQVAKPSTFKATTKNPLTIEQNIHNRIVAFNSNGQILSTSENSVGGKSTIKVKNGMELVWDKTSEKAIEKQKFAKVAIEDLSLGQCTSYLRDKKALSKELTEWIDSATLSLSGPQLGKVVGKKHRAKMTLYKGATNSEKEYTTTAKVTITEKNKES